MQMRVLAIQHDAADPPAAAGEIVEELDHELSVIRIDRGDPIPDAVDADLLMSFGGGVSLSGNDLPDWIADEQRLIRQYIDAGRRVLGVCLGGQMIAAALGEEVRRNEHIELGWHEVRKTDDVSDALDWLPQTIRVLHWHQDTFGIPSGALHLYQSDACRHQAFVIEDRIFAFQFHIEANERTVRVFNQVSPLRRREGSYVQDEQHVLAGINVYLPNQILMLESVMRNLLQ